MHVSAVPLFRDATGMAVALTAWARHRCLQLYFYCCSRLITVFASITVVNVWGEMKDFVAMN